MVDEDFVAWRQEYARQKSERVLCAVGDQDVIGPGGQSSPLIPVGDCFAQLRGAVSVVTVPLEMSWQLFKSRRERSVEGFDRRSRRGKGQVDGLCVRADRVLGRGVIR